MINKENENTVKMSVGTLYELNKNLIQQKEKEMTQEEINNKKEIIKNFIEKTDNNYYMLLSNERKDYTIFTMITPERTNNFVYDNKEKIKKLVNVLIDECLINRGEIRGIDLTETKDAIEIWLSIDKESYVYYFFPYDNAIINIVDELEVENEKNN